MIAMAAEAGTSGQPSLGARALRTILTSPVAMRIKRPLRELWWSVKGVPVANPAMPANVQSILFACLGNICRSPFAARLAALRLARVGQAGVRVASAGLHTRIDARSPREACEASARYGLLLEDHRPVSLTRQLVDDHDLIVVMDADQLTEARALYPHAAGKVVLLSLFDPLATAGYERLNIADPYGQPHEAFVACYERIDRAVVALIDCVMAHRPVDRSGKVYLPSVGSGA